MKGMHGSKNNAPKPSKYQDKGLPMAKKGGTKAGSSGFEQVPSMHNPSQRGGK